MLYILYTGFMFYADPAYLTEEAGMNERPKDKTGKTGATDIDPYGSKRIEWPVFTQDVSSCRLFRIY
ncbi:MAG: hypothetical protein Pg6A_09270 [Termitinemataceae bacterium]|nr:MAG: hypothetical protein Pg6A_09270 [Termitinemataceae bacterium]